MLLARQQHGFAAPQLQQNRGVHAAVSSRRCALASSSSRSRRVGAAMVRRAAEGEGPEGAPSLLSPGTKVKVATPIKVYHVPKQPQGVDLQGMQGEIEKNVAMFTDKQGKSHVLSPNFPYIVKLQTQIDGKDITIKAHLVSKGREEGENRERIGKWDGAC